MKRRVVLRLYPQRTHHQHHLPALALLLHDSTLSGYQQVADFAVRDSVHLEWPKQPNNYW